MAIIKIKKGLNIPISGEPEQTVLNGEPVSRVAVLGDDFIGMKPTMAAVEGDFVKKGQVLFTDKRNEGVQFTAPASGKISAIHRGEKRVFESLVIEVDKKEEEISFSYWKPHELADLSPEKVKNNLFESGLWTAMRERPFGRVASPLTTPHSIFVNAMDTEPLAPSVVKTLEGREVDFKNGLVVLSRLTEGPVFLCKAPGDAIPVADTPRLTVAEFAGPHPAGLPGAHIHFLDPVYRNKHVWTLDAQDVAAIGYLFTTGKLNVDRVIALTGPAMKQPALYRTRIGASIQELTNGKTETGTYGDHIRVLSGSVLSGRVASGSMAYLGRFHKQVCALPEETERRLLGWVFPTPRLFSIKSVFLSKLQFGKKFPFTTDVNGGKRAIVPVGSYESVMPLDLSVNYLLRAIMAGDLEECESLGFLELIEEDLALCSYVCPSKSDFGAALRNNLTAFEKEG